MGSMTKPAEKPRLRHATCASAGLNRRMKPRREQAVPHPPSLNTSSRPNADRPSSLTGPPVSRRSPSAAAHSTQLQPVIKAPFQTCMPAVARRQAFPTYVYCTFMYPVLDRQHMCCDSARRCTAISAMFIRGVQSLAATVFRVHRAKAQGTGRRIVIKKRTSIIVKAAWTSGGESHRDRRQSRRLCTH